METGRLPEKDDESLDWNDHSWALFLGRKLQPPIDLRLGELGEVLAGKTVLVTGAAGWIGSRLARRLKQSTARKVVLLDFAEGRLRQIDQTLLAGGGTVQHAAVLGSVCDQAILREALEEHRPEIIFHAAALKHVPVLENHPFEAIATNTLGTQTLMEAAVRFGCEEVVMVSTDKAVEPASVMGASKRLAELVMLNGSGGAVRTKVVRLGNVLGSSGSVVPLFLEQIALGGVLTVSHPEVRRFFMTTSEAVESLLEALLDRRPQGLLVAEPGSSISIVDLANFLIAQEVDTTGEQRESKKRVVFTSLRPGDKMEEAMISGDELLTKSSHGMLREVLTPAPSQDGLERGLNALRSAVEGRRLDELLRAIHLLVPEYTPGSLILRQVEEALSTVVIA